MSDPRNFMKSSDSFRLVLGTNTNPFFPSLASYVCRLSGQLLIVFRGTQTTKEWQENATGVMSLLEGEPEVSGLGLLMNREVNSTQCLSVQM